MRALVVDDNAHARAICLLALRRLGIVAADQAASGAEALIQLLQGPAYDVLLLDWFMPDITGAGVLQVLRDPRCDATVRLPVIVMTAYPSRDTLLRARRLGADDVLAKPFSTAQLAARLGRVLAPALQGNVAYL